MIKIKNKILERVAISVIFISIFLPSFFATYFWNLPGRIYGYTTFALIGSFAIYEVNNAIIKNKFISIFFALITILSLSLISYNEIEPIFLFGRDGDDMIGLSQRFFGGSHRYWKLLYSFGIILFLTFSFIIMNYKEFVIEGKFQIKKAIITFITYFITPLFIKTIFIINLYSICFLFFVLCIPIIADTTAYFGGMLLGDKVLAKYKFAPKLSPKKTYAGFIIGLIFTFAYAFGIGIAIGFWQSVHPTFYILIGATISLSLSFLSPMGDLMFSWFKRTLKIKDFSKILLSHGGIYDRVDAMSVVFATFGLILFFI